MFSSEAEVALAMTEFLLVHLGATAEQIDRQRDWIRHEVLGGGHQPITRLPIDLEVDDPGRSALED